MRCGVDSGAVHNECGHSFVMGAAASAGSTSCARPEQQVHAPVDAASVSAKTVQRHRSTCHLKMSSSSEALLPAVVLRQQSKPPQDMYTNRFPPSLRRLNILPHIT
jgi:hypothetical protein